MGKRVYESGMCNSKADSVIVGPVQVPNQVEDRL